MASPIPVVVGVDVGGTNTDAVVISEVKGQGHQILAEDKHLTTIDVTKGVRNAVLSVLRQASQGQKRPIVVKRINIGTTHFVNALVHKKDLSRVSVIRLCGPASRAVAPFADFPPRLRDVIYGSTHFVSGGYRVDGQEIESVEPEEIRTVVEEIKGKGVKGIVVCGIFSHTWTEQEEKAKQLILDLYPEASVTMSHTIGHLGLLERENGSILNEALKELCRRTVSGFRQALQDIGLTSCPMFLTQNDGTVISQQQAREMPVFTFASGPTNSMRGAAYLCQLTDAIVVDIGGTTTDVGVLKNCFPRQASTNVRVGGVRTNFRMPDVHSVGLGGGSYVVKTDKGKTLVGPLSAGYNLKEEALVFGSAAASSEPQKSGRRLTATDVAVAAGMMDLGDKSLVAGLPKADVDAAVRRIQKIVKDAIDSVRVSDEPLPVILVGGGSKLLDFKAQMPKVSQLLLPEHYGVANAIGAALSQVRAAGDLMACSTNISDTAAAAATDANAPWTEPPGVDILDTDLKTDVTKQLRSVTGSVLDPSSAGSEEGSDSGLSWAGLTPSRPSVDPKTGEWVLNAWDVECIAAGAAFLGAGGGGDLYAWRVRARVAVENGEKIRIVAPERLLAQSGPKDLLVCAAYMAAPLVLLEQLCAGQETANAIRCLQELHSIGRHPDGDFKNKEGVEIKENESVVYIDDYQPSRSHADLGEKDAVADFGDRKAVGVLCMEAGGLNAIDPMLVSVILDLPLVDADGVGRAIPMLQMMLAFIHGEKPYPTALVDDKGRRAVVLQAETMRQVEDHFRNVSVQMGSAAGLALPIIPTKIVMKSTAIRSYSRMWAIGDSILRARQRKESPIQALMTVEDARVLVVGEICDVTHEVRGGFDQGQVRVDGTAYDPTGAGGEEEEVDGVDAEEVVRLVLDFQNEIMVVRQVNEKGEQLDILATTPNTISVVDAETAGPITMDRVRYGQRVMVVVLPSPPSMASPRVLEVVGPAAFGYTDVEYAPLGRYREPEPLAPL